VLFISCLEIKFNNWKHNNKKFYLKIYWICIIQKNRQIVQYLYKLKLHNNTVSSKAWKCYRCNLTFTDEYHAALHEDLSKHHVREIQMIKV